MREEPSIEDRDEGNHDHAFDQGEAFVHPANRSGEAPAEPRRLDRVLPRRA